MPHTCKLDLEAIDGTHRKAAITFEDEEWELLRRARAYCADVRVPELIERGTWSTKLTIRWEAGQGLIAFGSLPPDEEISAVLHRLRPLILENEPTYFHRVTNIVARRAGDPGMSSLIDRLKALFAGKAFQQAVTITVDGRTVNSEETLKTYLNAHEFHRDEDKQAEIASLQEMFPTQAIRGIFILLIVDKLKAIRGLEMLLETLEGKREGFRL